ncbi:hypothetical protein [Catenulispora pinisilvae]|uniref:hypothetical protein n=1 Tax=Catenulispora pinisilvae TaxID=2705253 RepID=UPI001891F789|nr:hypothetical protein [Catenulispora pinisilvae]
MGHAIEVEVIGVHNIGIRQAIAAQHTMPSGKWNESDLEYPPDPFTVFENGVGMVTGGLFGSKPITVFLGGYNEKYRVTVFDSVTNDVTADFVVNNKSG